MLIALAHMDYSLESGDTNVLWAKETICNQPHISRKRSVLPMKGCSGKRTMCFVKIFRFFSYSAIFVLFTVMNMMNVQLIQWPVPTDQCNLLH